MSESVSMIEETQDELELSFMCQRVLRSGVLRSANRNDTEGLVLLISSPFVICSMR